MAVEERRPVYDPVERCPERICEAIVKLGDEASVLMPDQPWHKFKVFGKVLAMGTTPLTKTGCSRL